MTLVHSLLVAVLCVRPASNVENPSTDSPVRPGERVKQRESLAANAALHATSSSPTRYRPATQIPSVAPSITAVPPRPAKSSRCKCECSPTDTAPCPANHRRPFISRHSLHRTRATPSIDWTDPRLGHHRRSPLIFTVCDLPQPTCYSPLNPMFHQHIASAADTLGASPVRNHQ
ncbi:hypothetical protein J1614_005755 [Plenodomus biglobosus]|nr:hypothetical protein J1614_005755 [Plenodomus biglobosus]